MYFYFFLFSNLHRNISYNIPVEFWILDTYPNDVPISYVCPTSDMYIKTSTNIDVNGRISLPYLSEWKSIRRPNILGLIQSCVHSFNNNSPVLEKPHLVANNQQQPKEISNCPTVVS